MPSDMTIAQRLKRGIEAGVELRWVKLLPEEKRMVRLLQIGNSDPRRVDLWTCIEGTMYEMVIVGALIEYLGPKGWDLRCCGEWCMEKDELNCGFSEVMFTNESLPLVLLDAMDYEAEIEETGE